MQLATACVLAGACAAVFCQEDSTGENDRPCKRVDGASFNVDSALGVWFGVSQNSSKYTLRISLDQVDANKDMVKTTYSNFTDINWDQVTLYIDIVNEEQSYFKKFLAEKLNESGLVRLFTILSPSETHRDLRVLPLLGNIQNVNNDLVFILCEFGLQIWFQRPKLPLPHGGFDQRTEFDADASLGDWFAIVEDKTLYLKLMKKTPAEIEEYKSDMKYLQLGNHKIDWSEVNLGAEIAFPDGNIITCLFQRRNSSQAMRMFPVGDTLTIALKQFGRVPFSELLIKNLGDKLVVNTCSGVDDFVYSR